MYCTCTGCSAPLGTMLEQGNGEATESNRKFRFCFASEQIRAIPSWYKRWIFYEIRKNHVTPSNPASDQTSKKKMSQGSECAPPSLSASIESLSNSGSSTCSAFIACLLNLADSDCEALIKVPSPSCGVRLALDEERGSEGEIRAEGEDEDEVASYGNFLKLLNILLRRPSKGEGSHSASNASSIICSSSSAVCPSPAASVPSPSPSPIAPDALTPKKRDDASKAGKSESSDHAPPAASTSLATNLVSPKVQAAVLLHHALKASP